MARPSVPKFGQWDNDNNVPYTVYFDKARKGRGGKMINPNDPQENPDLFPDMSAPTPAPAPAPAPIPASSSRAHSEPEEPIGRRPIRSTHDHRASKEESDLKFSESPGHVDNVGRRAGGAHQRGGASSGRPTRPSVGSDYSLEKSPLHPNYHAKLQGKGGAAPGLEGKNSNDSSHGTPGRSRMRPARGEESPDRGAQVPRFGEWDENNPQSADNYTHIFNKVREERATGSPMVGTDAKPSYNTVRNQKGNDSKGCWWLPCFGK